MASLKSLKSARTRRQRGYGWEDALVKRFNACDGWRAFRLGSPSIALPDVIATSTSLGTILAIEAKSGTSNSIPVPKDQIERCLRWLDVFSLYPNRKAVVAFKFMSKKWKRAGVYDTRERREYFKLWNPDAEPCELVCRYDGSIYARVDNGRKDMKLEDYRMPFRNGETEGF